MNLAKKIEDKRRAKRIQERNKKAKIATLGIATGAITGVLGGVLFAPKSGKETRENIKNTSIDVTSKVSNKAHEVKDTLNNNVKESKTKIKEYLENRRNNSKNDDIKSLDDLSVNKIDTNEESLEV